MKKIKNQKSKNKHKLLLKLIFLLLLIKTQSIYAEEIKDGIYTIESTLEQNKVIDLLSANTTNRNNIQLCTANNTNAQKWIIQKREDGYYTIKSSIEQNKVIDISDGNFHNKSNVQIYVNNNTNAQRWKIINLGEEIYTFKTIDDKYCLDIDGANTKPGTNIQIYSCNNTNAQKFRLIEDFIPEKTVEDGLYTIASTLNENKVIDLYNANTANGNNIQIYNKNSTNAQKWKIEYKNNGYYNIKSKINKNKCLDIKGGNFTSGNNVQIYDCNNSEAQDWIIKKQQDETYTIISRKKGIALDLAGANTNNGSNIQIYFFNKTKAQMFKLNKINEQEVEEGIYKITSSENKNMTLDVQNGSSTPNTKVQLFNQNNTNAQFWYFQKLENGNYLIRSALHSALYLSYENNAIITSKTRTEWTLNNINDELFSINNKNNLYITINNNQLTNGTSINLENQNNNSSQTFYLKKTQINTNSRTLANGYYTINSKLNPKKVIDAENGNKLNETNIQLYDQNNTNAQIWYLKYENNGYYSINSALNPNVSIDLKGGSTQNNTNIQLYKKNNSDAQNWKILDNGRGEISIVSKKANICATVKNSITENGSNIEATTCNNNNNQLFTLEENNTSKVYNGIDVSSYQGKINWDSVAKTKIDFAVIKLGFGDNWTSQDDKYFEENVKNCEKYNIPYAVYLYSYAKNITGSTKLNADSESATSEAEHVLRLLKKVNYKPNLKTAVYIDMEEEKLNYLGKDKLTSIATKFCENVEASGYACGIYANKSWLSKYLNSQLLASKYNIWLAEWLPKITSHNQIGDKKPTYNSTSYRLWQFTDQGTINGITTNVDLDIGYNIFD